MSLRFLIIDSYYQNFLTSVYTADHALATLNFEQQRHTLFDYFFGTADFYSSNLGRLGHEAEEIISNCEPLQRAWAREHHLPWPVAVTPTQKNRRLLQILQAQIQDFKPDVLYLQNLYWPGADFLREIRPEVKLIIGQIAYGLHPRLDLSPYDLILTALPHFVEKLRQQGGNCDYFRIGFEEKILQKLDLVQPCYPAAFIGTYNRSTGAHAAGTRLLEYVASRTPVQFWGHGTQALDADSPIRRSFHGEAWGFEMYRILAQTGIVLNRHAVWAENYANNMRLYEATGVGAMLLTDAKDNLNQLFQVGTEVVAYRSQYECVELLRYYLEHDAERAAIAAAGQRRTLKEHTYYHRMQELVDIVERYVRQSAQTAARRYSIPMVNQIEVKSGLTQRAIEIAKPIIQQTPLANLARSLWYRWQDRSLDTYQLIAPTDVSLALNQGWQETTIPDKQRERVNQELWQMYAGKVEPVFRVAAQSVVATGQEYGTICEIGCASGYYYEILEYLLGHRVIYTGLDYSLVLIERACREYPDVPFGVVDGASLPLANQSYDIIISGCVLLHMMNYQRAIAETARAAKHWCIFHRTPVMVRGQTTHMTKSAYGVPVVELAFGESELLSIFTKNGLKVSYDFSIGQHRLSTLKDQVEIKTYVCCKDIPGENFYD